MLYVTRLGRATDNRHLHNNQAIRRAQLELQRIVSLWWAAARSRNGSAERRCGQSDSASRSWPHPLHG